LSAVANLRYPAPEPAAAWLRPSLDVTAFLVLLATLAHLGRRVPGALCHVFVVALLFVRVFRFVDGVEQRYLHRHFDIYLELPLLPEAVRLLAATVPAQKLAIAGVLAIAAFAALAWVAARALAYARSYLGRAEGRRVFTVTCASLLLVAVLLEARDNGANRAAVFAPSVAPPIAAQLSFWLSTDAYRSSKLAEVEARRAELDRYSDALAGLGGASVLVFVVEAYGQTVFDSQEMRPRYAGLETAFRKAGYAVASTLLDSPVYGGGSWLAQATLITGVRVENELDYALLKAQSPRTAAQLFRGAGYRTVLFHPGTTRAWPQGDYLGFDVRYSAPDFEYRGPAFAWAPIPDQYVVDFMHRREVDRARRPLFALCALVSSHAPFSEQPPLVEDWSALDGGRVYSRLAPVRFATSWTNLEHARPAYLRAIGYDLAVLEQYLTGFPNGDALVFVLGDHQPVGDVTGHSPRRGVPVHVLSRDLSLVDEFLVRGYTPGMWLGESRASSSLARFLPTLLEVSEARRAAEVRP
jgi:hypothetical protein